eukprot:TRINITY_DN5344_c0_g1_i2.p1 TRINITY_DN5344_c0_g1~~TRINITY_DN5344_c0_g1_i2.p1  ORF type:complete len:158 (+),score=32.54 TRINITY_DN5344_c0_g1_i2:47-520(+)
MTMMMMKGTLAIIIAILCTGATLASYTEKEYQTSFTNWMQEHKKEYSSEEFKIRFEIFSKNMDYVAAWNADPSHTHQVGLNLFADLTNEEYRNIYLMKKVNFSANLAAAAEDIKSSPSSDKSMPLADTVNWVNKGAVTAIKSRPMWVLLVFLYNRCY